MVRHGGHRQLQSAPLPHLTCIGATGVHHMFAGDITEFGTYTPLAAGQLLNICCTAPTYDGGTELPCTSRHRLCHTGRINVSVVRGVQRTEYTIEVIERMQLSHARGLNQFNIKSKCRAHAERLAQPVHLILCVGDAKGPTAVPGNRLPCLALQSPRIQADVVVNTLTQPKA